ncbi:MAG: methyltransferase domain-containing protein [Acidimicrobiales bacterium]
MAASASREHEDAAARWERDLESWAIPEEILRAAPESPWGFPPGLFATAAACALEDAEPTPSRARALDALPSGGSVLDVGAGGGAASLPLAPPAALLVAVDESQAMLNSFAEAATRRRARHELIAGRWPDVAATAPVADVVVCHHVAYNVPDLAPFLRALTDHARYRVVLELTERHPLSGLAPLWLSIHGLERPTAPVAADAVEVAGDLGYDVHALGFTKASLWDGAPLEDRVAFARRQLCVGPEHDEEIAAFFEAAGAGERRELATLWWDVPDR